MNNQHLAKIARHHGHRCEVADRIKGHVLVEGRRRGLRAGVEQPRIAIGRRLGDEIGTERCTAAATIVEHDRLPHRD